MSSVKNYDSIAEMWDSLGKGSVSRITVRENLHISRSTLWRIIKACREGEVKGKWVVFADRLKDELSREVEVLVKESVEISHS